jgi:hypothetical protein
MDTAYQFKNMNDNKVLPFTRVDRVDSAALASELRDLLVVYDKLTNLLRETYDEGLDLLTDNLVMSAVRCREALASGIEKKNGQAMTKEMRDELRQLPRSLRSLLPGIGPRLVESLEQKLGIRFSSF